MKRQRLERRLQSHVISTCPVRWIQSGITRTGHPASVVVATSSHAIRLLVVPVANCVCVRERDIQKVILSSRGGFSVSSISALEEKTIESEIARRHSVDDRQSQQFWQNWFFFLPEP